jgi:transposase
VRRPGGRSINAILEENLMAVSDAGARVSRCEQAMEALLGTWRLRPAVEALMAFKGFALVAAMITVSEIGDLHRFEHPRHLMGYLGLVPSENTSGAGRRQGAITKCGNPHLRWLLIDHRRAGRPRGRPRASGAPKGRDERERASQCAQHYAAPPKVSKELSRRQEGQPPEVIKTSWRAQARLNRRLMALMARRVHRNRAMVAVARELAAFIWEALRPLACYRADEATREAQGGEGGRR